MGVIRKLSRMKAIGIDGIVQVVRLRARQKKMVANMSILKEKSRQYFGWMPDSLCNFSNHPEAEELWKLWIHDNQINNCGDFVRFFALILNIKYVLERNIQGEFAELGVYKGNSVAILAHYARLSDRRVYAFDTYEGFDERDLKGIDSKFSRQFADTSLAKVKKLAGEENVVYVKGYFPESVTDNGVGDHTYAFVSLDCDLYEPMYQGLKYFHPRMAVGGGDFLPRLFIRLLGGMQKCG